MTSSVRFGKALRRHHLLQVGLFDGRSTLLLFIYGAQACSQSGRPWKSWVMRMWHGSVHVIGYGGKQNMWYLQLGWVGCRSITSRDDSPFAYIFSGAVNFLLGAARWVTRVFRTCAVLGGWQKDSLRIFRDTSI